jgi:hypothetical protein
VPALTPCARSYFFLFCFCFLVIVDFSPLLLRASPLPFLNTPMFQLTVMRRSVVGVAVTAAVRESTGHQHRPISHHNPYFTMRPRTLPPTPPPQSALTNTSPTPSEARLKGFKRFYETVTRSREATSLPPTPLGYGGSERILNNELLHESPWQASCVELRERAVVEETKALSYDSIDFASLRRRHRRGGAAPLDGKAKSYSNVEDMRPKGPSQQGPGLDVVHYYETSSPAGLAGYQRVAMQVRQGMLPGTCTNFSAEGGFAVWVVPLNDYTQAMSAMGFLPT